VVEFGPLKIEIKVIKKLKLKPKRGIQNTCERLRFRLAGESTTDDTQNSSGDN